MSEEKVVFDVEGLLREQDPDGKLGRYFELLDVENRRINLVSRETLPESAPEHVDRFHGLRQLAAESLFPIAQIAAKPHRYLDIGSGGGFPAIPILLTQPVTEAVLAERTQKKAGVLRRMVTGLGLTVRVEATTFEELKLAGESFDLITLRLVRLTGPLQKRILRLLAPEGNFIYYAGTDVPLDITHYSVRRLCFAPEGAPDFHTATVVTRKPR